MSAERKGCADGSSVSSAARNREPLRWRINKAIPRAARRFKPGSWANRTVYRAGPRHD